MKIEAYAKVNFTLEVFGRRADGYHALRSLVLPVSLSDTIEMDKADEVTSDAGYDDDLCVRAARAIGAGGVKIHVTKRIPSGGGLGGGSADAAAVLIGMNAMYGLGLSREKLAEIGSGVGSDVPALVLGGPTVMEGRGEIVSRISLPVLHLVIAYPEVSSSTAEVYARCSVRENREPDLTRMAIEAIGRGDADDIAGASVNGLQEAATVLHPEIANAMDILADAGAMGVTMTGSGSCVFGQAQTPAMASEIAAKVNARGMAAWDVRTVSR